MMNVTIFGTGYVGLVTGVGLANMGHKVICADISDEKIDILNSGSLPIWEEGLKELLDKAKKANKIKFTTNIEESVKDSDILFITVGTPSLPDGDADLLIARQIGKYSRTNKIVVIKSTVPVGTTDEVELVLKQLTSDNIDIDVVSNPEFLRQGKAVYDFFHPDRIIVGTDKNETREVIKKLYGDYAALIQFHDRKSAEMIKYASNAFLAMKISYINMIAGVCDKVGANIDSVAKGIGADRRIGNSFLQAGVGFGGSCFPKDTEALIHMGKKMNYDLSLIAATNRINDNQPYMMVIEKLKSSLGDLKNKKIALLGLTFKPNTDDLREAPSLKVSRSILAEGASLNAYDPVVSYYPVEDVKLYNNVYDAISSSDAMIILTEWEEFKYINWEKVFYIMGNPLIIDGRNMFSLDEMKQLGSDHNFTYCSVGRPIISASNN